MTNVEQLLRKMLRPARVLLVGDAGTSQLHGLLERTYEWSRFTVSDRNQLVKTINEGVKYDIAFVELVNGELLNAIRRLKESDPTLPIVIVTAQAGTDIQNECLRYGMVSVMKKPISSIDLEQVFRSFKIRAVEKPVEPADETRSDSIFSQHSAYA